MNEQPIACNLEAFDPEEQQHYQALRSHLRGAIRETRELPFGYALRLPAETATIRMAAEFITLERQCCPFFDFALVVEGAGAVWLRLTGAEGAKTFLQAEFRCP